MPIDPEKKTRNFVILICVLQLIILYNLGLLENELLVGSDNAGTKKEVSTPKLLTSSSNPNKQGTSMEVTNELSTTIPPPYQPREDAQCANKVFMRTSRHLEREKTFATKDLFEKCEFVPLEEGGPQPVVFLVNGRSGSTNTWGTLATLAGGHTPIGEHTGQNKVTAIDFMGNMTTQEEGYWFMKEFLCEFSRLYCDKPLAGIKWKPFTETWDMPAAKGFLDFVENFSFGEKNKIKLIFMSRNQLDVLLSNRKHKRMKHKFGGRIYAHCDPDDETCLKEHKEASEAIKLPTENLVQELKALYDGLDYFENTLNESGIEYYRTYYEKLYNSDDAEEWINILKYLGRGQTKDLTMDDVRDAMPFASTTSKTHRDMLNNYDEVKQALAGTPYAHLLN